HCAMNYAAHPALASKLQGWRSRLLLMLLLLLFAALAGRAMVLQGLKRQFLQEQGEARYGRTIPLAASRGIVTDRHGEPLAMSSPVETIWANPKAIRGRIGPADLHRLAQLLGVDADRIRERLDEEKSFVYLKRQLPPEQAE